MQAPRLNLESYPPPFFLRPRPPLFFLFFLPPVSPTPDFALGLLDLSLGFRRDFFFVTLPPPPPPPPSPSTITRSILRPGRSTLATRTVKRSPMVMVLPDRWATRAPVVWLSCQRSLDGPGRSEMATKPSMRVAVDLDEDAPPDHAADRARVVVPLVVAEQLEHEVLPQLPLRPLAVAFGGRAMPPDACQLLRIRDAAVLPHLVTDLLQVLRGSPRRGAGPASFSLSPAASRNASIPRCTMKSGYLRIGLVKWV